MHERPLSAETLRAAAGEIAESLRSRAVTPDVLDAAVRVVTEALLDQAEHRAPTVSQPVVDARAAAAGADVAAMALPSGRPLEVLRAGARNAAERSLVAALFARHLGAVLERRDGVSALRAMLPSLDWLEFNGQYPPYTAARHALDAAVVARLDDILRAAPVEAPTEATAAAVRALRGHPAGAPAPAVSPAPAVVHEPAPPHVQLSGEVEGFERPLWWRALTVMLSAVTGAARAVLRGVFSLRSPAAVSLDGDQVRVSGHTEILGRTLRTFDVRMPLANLTEIRRESRFPMLPVAASVFSLFVGSTLGAKYMIEGVGGRYWVLVALGLGLIAAGVLFDFLLRAVFPGVTGRTRLVLRGRDRRGLVLTGLDVAELERLLAAMESRLARGPAAVPSATAPALRPLLSGAEALSAETIRDPEPARRARR